MASWPNDFVAVASGAGFLFTAAVIAPNANLCIGDRTAATEADGCVVGDIKYKLLFVLYVFCSNDTDLVSTDVKPATIRVNKSENFRIYRKIFGLAFGELKKKKSSKCKIFKSNFIQFGDRVFTIDADATISVEQISYGAYFTF